MVTYNTARLGDYIFGFLRFLNAYFENLSLFIYSYLQYYYFIYIYFHIMTTIGIYTRIYMCANVSVLYIVCLGRAFRLVCYGRTLYACGGMDRWGNVDGDGDFPPQNTCSVQVFSRPPYSVCNELNSEGESLFPFVTAATAQTNAIRNTMPIYIRSSHIIVCIIYHKTYKKNK